MPNLYRCAASINGVYDLRQRRLFGLANRSPLSGLSRVRAMVRPSPPGHAEGFETRLGVMRRGIAATVAACLLFSVNAAASDAPRLGPDSNLPVPRFVSLGAENANGRRGPGLEHRIDWIYARAGLPLQVIAESGPWRRVRDPDGAEVWMHARNLDQRRTAYVRSATQLRRRPDGPVAAYLAPGVIGAVTACEGGWARIAVSGRVGWVERAELWGGEDCAGL